MEEKMSKKKINLKHERVKSSLIRSKKSINPINEKNILSNNTNNITLSTSNNFGFSKINTLSKKIIYKIKSLKSTIPKKRESPNIKLISSMHRPKTISIPNIKQSNDETKKKYLRAKLCNLLQKNIVLNENKFHPRKFTESISNVHVKSFKNRFKNFDDRVKVGIFTNKYPIVLNGTDKFYSRYFDYFMSPDEILANNFTKKEIFLIKTEPGYYNIDGNFNGIDFFKKKNLRDILNEEEKIGIHNVMELDMQKSLKKSKRKIRGYLNYYTSVMSRRGLIYN